MNKHCLALDLKDDPELVREYIKHHKSVWPEIKQSIRDSGIINMEIYNTGNRLFMIMETEDWFSFDDKVRMDNENPKVQEWEGLMWRFQKALPWARPGEKWVLMDKIFGL